MWDVIKIQNSQLSQTIFVQVILISMTVQVQMPRSHLSLLSYLLYDSQSCPDASEERLCIWVVPIIY